MATLTHADIATPPTLASRWPTLATLCLSVLLVSMDNMIVNVALPDISRSFLASTSTLQWVVDGYVVSFAGLLLTAGHLGDHYGRRRVMQIGLAVFALSSVLAATAGSAQTLIAGRVVMGLGAALVYPSTLAILTDVFHDSRSRGIAIGVWSGVSGMGLALGPVLGGLLMRQFRWSSVFLINIPIVLVSIVAGWRLLPESRSRTAAPLDVVGATLSMASITALVYTIIEAPGHGWRSARTALGFATALVLLAGLVFWLRKAAHPLVDGRLFRNRRFSVSASALAVAFFALFGFTFLITMYFQLVRGYDTLAAGMATLPYAIVMGALSPVSIVAARRVGARWTIGVGMLLMAAGLWVATLAQADSSYLLLVIPSMVLMASGMALATGPATNAVMGAVPSDQAGAGSAFNDTARQVGGALGTAVLGSVLSSAFVTRLADGWSQWNMPADAVSAAQDSLGAAQSVSAHMPAPLADALAGAANSAYIDAMHHAIWVGIAAALLSAALAFLFFPDRRNNISAPRQRVRQPEEMDTVSDGSAHEG